MSALLAAESVTVRRGGRALVEAASLSLRAGEVLALVGPNGAGKSTLLRTLAGLETPASGTVRLEGRPLAGWPVPARVRRIGYLPQSFTPHWDLTARALIGLGAGRGAVLPWGGTASGPADAPDGGIDALAAGFDLADRLDRPWSTLSGGERGRALLAAVLATEPPVLLADEPAAALDIAQQLRLMRRLRARADAGRGAAIVVLHDLNLAARWCDRVAVLRAGRLVLDGESGPVLRDPALDAAFGVRFRRTAEAGRVMLWPEEG
ncbi:ABC transporter ATP-binding protein [Roseomonas sp. NAR14]|uniref:ABC transporter ATP-binding protein n=1 Tax=Roseomonas acroporae TaxID=2937791 RepID=A0A9X1Y6S3_9PROT|nr:ABC transporter ATP-binding protein [Roseomonas acroporae]MCK8784180.1 ABC transporter ATP-binding protein [Roseomonas acroporae]